MFCSHGRISAVPEAARDRILPGKREDCRLWRRKPELSRTNTSGNSTTPMKRPPTHFCTKTTSSLRRAADPISAHADADPAFDLLALRFPVPWLVGGKKMRCDYCIPHDTRRFARIYDAARRRRGLGPQSAHHRRRLRIASRPSIRAIDSRLDRLPEQRGGPVSMGSQMRCGDLGHASNPQDRRPRLFNA